MSDYTPVTISDAAPFTKTAGGSITGGTLVTASGDEAVVTSTTGDRPIGVAAHDAGSGQRVTIWPLADVVHEISPQGVVAIAANNPIVAGTTGLINTASLATAAAAGTLLGICVKGGTGGTSKARFIGS